MWDVRVAKVNAEPARGNRGLTAVRLRRTRRTVGVVYAWRHEVWRPPEVDRFFIVLGVALVGGALALNVGWVIVSWRQAGLLVAGLLVFPLIITGVVLNTIFLVREIRRNEQHEAFINAVTHELKTPVASMKLYLQTLQNRPVDDAKRQEFYSVMLEDSDRLLGTIEQVLRAGQLGARAPAREPHADRLSARSSRSASRWRGPAIGCRPTR